MQFLRRNINKKTRNGEIISSSIQSSIYTKNDSVTLSGNYLPATIEEDNIYVVPPFVRFKQTITTTNDEGFEEKSYKNILEVTSDGLIINGNVIATGEVSAYGSGNTSGSSSGTVTVYDALDSNSTDVALSANQGRVLNEKITEINSKIESGVTTPSSLTLTNLSDINISSGITDKQILVYNAKQKKWINSDNNATNELAKLTDVSLSGVTDKQILIYDKANSKWTNQTFNIESSALTQHLEDNVKHITADERTNWNKAYTSAHSHSNIEVLNNITSNLINNWNSGYSHIEDSSKHITTTERTSWNNKLDKSVWDKAFYFDDLDNIRVKLNVIGEKEISAYGSGVTSDGSGVITIVDSLTSNSTDAALSANQGRVLKNLIDNIDVGDLDLSAYSKTGHTHAIADITNLQTALNAKSSTSHTHNNYSLTSHTHNDYAASSHTHSIANITNLQSTLDAKSGTGHSHSNYSLTSHTHPQYASSSHTHNYASNVKVGSTNYAVSANTISLPSYPTLSSLSGVTTTNFNSHSGNTTLHITADERTNWNKAYNNNHTHSNKTVLDGITSTKVSNWDTVYKNWNNVFTINSNGDLQVKVNVIGEKEISAFGSGTTSDGSGVLTIVDSLTSTATDAALSANQGRVLKSLIDNIDVGDLDLSAYSKTGHTHVIADITNLQTALNAKSSTSHTHNNYSLTSHTHSISGITDLQKALDAKSGTGHSHSNYSLTSHTHSTYYDSAISRTKNTVLAAPNGSAGTATFRSLVAADIPTLAISKISGLQTALDGKSATSHSHSNYSLTSHTHTFASITSKPTTLSGYGITDAPTKTGTGASGTWGISISGNAATATNSSKFGGYSLRSDYKFENNKIDAMIMYTIDATSLSTSNFYPIVFAASAKDLKVNMYSTTGNNSFAYNQNTLDFIWRGQGWNDTPQTLTILNYNCYVQTEQTIGCLGMGLEGGVRCIWVRGGLTYYITSNQTPTLKTASYTSSNEIFTVGTNLYGGTNTKVTIVWTPQTTSAIGKMYHSGGFVGSLTGTATKATADANGNTITSTYATKSELSTHSGNTTVHITSTERTNWNKAYNNNHTHSNKTVLDGITSTKVSNWDTVYSNWNKAFSFDSSGNLKVSVNVIGEKEISAYGSGVTSDGSGVLTIVDNLTSNSTDAALSANQGRVLKNLIDNIDVGDLDLSAYSKTGHTHAIADITNLQTALNAKSSTSHTHPQYASSSHTHSIANITNLQSTLDAKSGTGHSHSNYSLTSHTHSAYASTSHTHSNYSLTSHTHSTYYDSAISRTKNTVLAAPNGSAGTATFRSLVAADIPALAISKITNLQSTLDAKSGTGHSHSNYSLTSHTHSAYASTSHTHSNYSLTSHSHTTIVGNYTSNGGQQNPNYFGRNRLGALMMNTKVNGNTSYKDWIIMDCYGGNDAGGAVAIGVNRLGLGAYIMRSTSARTTWDESAELIGTHNYTSYCATKGHTHSYLPLAGGTMTGVLTLTDNSSYVASNTASAILAFGNNSVFTGAFSTNATIAGSISYPTILRSSGNDLYHYSNSNSTRYLILDANNYTSYCATKGHTHSTLTFSGGTFAAKTYNPSGATTVNIPTHTSHITNNSGYITTGATVAAANKVTSTLTFSAGTFAAGSFNGSAAKTINVPTHTSHITNNSGYITTGATVAAANKLATSRTLWGQSFNGTANVTGNITGSYFKINDTSSNPYLQLTQGQTWYIQGYNGYLYLGAGSTKSLRIDATGNCYSVGEVTAYSDKRLKNNIQELKNRGELKPVTYIKDGKQSIGFIAQDVQELYPELVHTDESTEEKYLSLNYAQLTAVLAAQINELKKEIEELKKQINK